MGHSAALGTKFGPGEGGARIMDLAWRKAIRRFAAGFIPVVIAVAVVWPFLPRRFEASATIVMRPADMSGSGSEGELLRRPLDEAAVQSEIDRISSPAFASVVIKQNGLEERLAGSGLKRFFAAFMPPTDVQAGPSREGQMRRRLNEHLKVERDRRSYTVKFGYWWSDPTKAVAMTETLLTTYLNDQISRKQQVRDAFIKQLRQQADALRSKYEASDHAVRDFLTRSGLIDTGAQLSLEGQLSAFSNEAAQARARIIEATARLQTLQEMQKAGTLESAPEVLSSPSVRHLKEVQAAALARIPVIESEAQAVFSAIAAEANRIVQGAQAEVQVWKQREALLREELMKIQSQIAQRRENELRLDELKKDASLDRATLDGALTKLREQIASSGNLRPDADVIAPPERPLQPASPNLLLTALGTLMAASLAGAAAAWKPLMVLAARYLKFGSPVTQCTDLK